MESTLEATTTDQRAEFVAGLRALADWYDHHPEIDLPYQATTGPVPARFSVGIFPSDEAYAEGIDDTAERFAAATKALGGSRRKQATETSMTVIRTFGPGLELDIWASRERVCEAVVVGTKTVQREEVITPAVTRLVVEDQDVIEWRCAPLLEAAQS